MGAIKNYWVDSVKILGVDTTTKFLCLALYDGGKTYEYNLEAGIKLSRLITPAIQRVIAALNWKIDDIDYFAVGLGPGSFTGVRVGLATIKGLAWSLNKPIVGISSLDILARNVNLSHAHTDGYVLPAIDAKRGLVYTCIYKIKNGILKRTSPYMLLTVEEFLNKVKNNTVVLGDAINLYKEKLVSSIKGLTLLDKDYWYLRPGNIIGLALERIEEKSFGNSFGIKPIYLYPKECQIKTVK